MKKLFLLLAAIVTLALSAQAQNHTYSGTVLSSADDEPLAGASVKPVGGIATSGVMTNADGMFTITLPASVKQVTVSYVGMKSATVNLSDNMKIYLDNDTKVLDQVVVTGYGSGKKLGSVVGSVSVVGSEAFETTPATTFVDALQGQVPGLAIYSNSGDPSSVNNSIVLRGINSLTAGNTPLFILDGAEISSSLFTTLNPSDIENITVLKDAASIAIYGSRGANGIIITSKKGKFGKRSNVTIRANYGWSQMVPDNVEMMNSEQYIKYRDLIGAPVSNEVRNLVDNYGISTNWRDEIFKSSAPTYSLEGVVEGGTENLSYYLSLNHYDQDGLIEHSELRRETLRFSLDSKVNNWFRVGFQGNLGYAKYETNAESDALYSGDGLYGANPMYWARLTFPYDSPYYYSFNDNGDIVYGDKAQYMHYSRKGTPAYYYSTSDVYRTRVTANLNLYEQITPIKGLTLKALQAVEAYDEVRSSTYYPEYIWKTPMGDFPNGGSDSRIGEVSSEGQASRTFIRSYQWTYTNTAEYRTTIAEKHNISALIGQEAKIYRYHGFGGSTQGLTDARMMLLSQGSRENRGLSESKSKEVFNSYFANMSYDFDNRYFVEGTIRRDGSSIFAPHHRWGTFGALGLMWNIKNEKFLQDKTWIDALKIRYSYGAAGNNNIDPFLWQGTVTTGNPYAGNPSIVIDNPANNSLTWETVYSHDLGFDFGFFDRLHGTVDLYYKRTENMLMEIPYSETTGLSAGYGNICEMSNKGIEVELTGDIFKNKDWYIGARVGFAYNKNEITKLFDGSDFYVIPRTGVCYEVGGVAGQYYMVNYAGVDPSDGKQVWYDKNGNKTKVFPSDAYVPQKKSHYAPWTGGFSANVRWRDFSVSTTFSWAAKKYMINNDKYFIMNNARGATNNQMVEMLNVWTTPGQVTDIPAATETITTVVEDTRWLEDASFLRLKNLTVAYNLPRTLVNKWGMQSIQFHFTGRNLWTVTDFSGYDPEPNSNMVQFQYPNTRQYEFGVEVSF